jgi:hypothetical protein
MNAPVQAAAPAEIPVRYEVAGKVVKLEEANRISRRLLESQTKKFRKKFSHLKGQVDDKGRLATIVLRLPKLGSASIECAIEYPESLQGQVEGHEKAVRIS